MPHATKRTKRTRHKKRTKRTRPHRLPRADAPRKEAPNSYESGPRYFLRRP